VFGLGKNVEHDFSVIGTRAHAAAASLNTTLITVLLVAAAAAAAANTI